jgi:hypothetical protein
MKKQLGVARLLTVLLAVGMLLLPTFAHAYWGLLSSADLGLHGTGEWVAPGPAELEWWVTDNMDGSWHYKYQFSHPGSATSHFIFEVSANLTVNDVFNETGDFANWKIEDYTSANGNPNMPGGVHGLKFDETWGNVTVAEFDAWRPPMWGDFYAKGGKVPGTPVWNAAWNSGFAAADPIAAFHDGPEQGHLLVPDTGPPPPVPEPSTMLLLGSGLIGTIAVLRRRRG